MDDRSELETRQTSMAVVIDENIGLADGYQRGPKLLEEDAYPFQVSVCGVICVKITKAFGYIQQL